MDESIKNEEALKRYLKEFQMMNRIMTALSSTKNIDDIYSIILSALVSPSGLGFTRSVLFSFDRGFNAFTGRLALGPDSPEEARRFQEDIKKEEEALEALTRNHAQEDDKRSELWDSCMDGLKVSAVWISAVQKYGPDNPITKSVRRLSYSGASPRKGEDFLHYACGLGEPRLFDKKEMTRPLPKTLDRILEDRFISIPIRSKNRRHAVVLADRKFADRDADESDLHHLRWFSNQVSLAVENALLYNDLEEAYNDLKEMDILKSNFLSTVSHELRTPLTTIHGFVELLVEGKVGELSDKQQQLLARVARNAQHLITMVNDIIEVAEIQAHGMADFKLKPIDPLPILMASIHDVQERKDQKVVNIEPQLNEKPPPPIMADDHSLERILYHLLDNAVKFSHDDGLVTVRFEEEDGELRIIIQDEGIGIDSGLLHKIFDDFFQADGKLNRVYEGLGLGLTITRLLLSATGGKIQAESRVGEGSVFTIIYPVAEN